jgi:hypothetical protein
VEMVVGLIVLVALIVGGFMLFNRLRASPTADRASRAFRSRIDEVQESKHREPTVETLRPGDAIAFSDGSNVVVTSVLECQEQVGPRNSVWRWSFLDDRRMLEAARDGNVLYERQEVARQEGPLFERFVAEADQGGILKLFEQRVRANVAASTPVTFEYADRTFHLRSTGTFTAKHSGRSLGEVWEDISPQAGDNVYFEAEAPTGEQLLGIWTSHIALLVGQPVGLTDIDAIYPGGEELA